MKLFFVVLMLTNISCKVRNFSSSSKENSKTGGTLGFFEDSDPVNITLEADFEKVFERRKKSNGRLEAVNQNTPGSLVLNRPDGSKSSGKVKVTSFGNTSLTQCSFPKIKIEFDNPNDIPELGDTKILMLATHCAPTDASLGRQMGDAFVVREWFVYEMGRILELSVPRSRLLNITYASKGTNPKPTETHPAFALEYFGETAKRYNSVISTPKVIASPVLVHKIVSEMEPINLAKGHMFEAFIGNNDWILTGVKSVFPVSFWNLEILRDEANGKSTPLFFDFDLSRIVSKFTPETQPPLKTMSRLIWNDNFNPELKGNAARTNLEVQFVRSRHSEKAMKATREFYLSKRKVLEKGVENFKKFKIIDDSEMEIVEEFIRDFYNALDDKNFLTPLIVSKGVGSGASFNANPTCANLPQGLPVKLTDGGGTSTGSSTISVTLPFKPEFSILWGCGLTALNNTWKITVDPTQISKAEAAGVNPANAKEPPPNTNSAPELQCPTSLAKAEISNPLEEIGNLEELGCSESKAN